MRRLIVSADDFGLSPGVNAGILKAHREGILTNASVMVNGSAFDEAVDMARANPTLGVGLHLVLVQGRSRLSPEEIPGLVSGDRMFRTNPVASGMRYYFDRRLHAQIEREVCAQLEAFCRTGLPLSHVDGHLNIHMHPTVLGILLRVAPRYDIRALRLPREPFGISIRLDARERPRKTLEALTFKALDGYASAKLAAHGMHHADQVFGLHQSGHVTEGYLLGVIAALPDGVTEDYTHASIVDDDARRWRPADYECEGELAALTSAPVRAALQTRGVECIRYSDLG